MKVLVLALVITVAACAPEPGDGPAATEVEVVKQGLFAGPIADWVPNRVIIGRVEGSGHWVVHQRQDNMTCWWRKISDRGLSLTQDVIVWTGNNSDVGIVAPDNGINIVCDGFTYKLFAPNQVDENGYYLIEMRGGSGKDVLHCQGYTLCQGESDDDKVIGWGSQYSASGHVLELDGGQHQDKVLSFTADPVKLRGGDDPDCIASAHPDTVLEYTCGWPNDPAFDKSAGWIGPWCNALTEDFCQSFPW